ncbi:hypothetical protein ACFV94_23970 [Streptomyces sp. NPDC059896]|uniref:hypothetical protein n=1 Tax=Streptomyces sp. NPDC059896 TaxID=3346993 RepID=UPI00364FDE9A
MTLTLAESAKLTQDMLKLGVIEMFIQESPILDRLPDLAHEEFIAVQSPDMERDSPPGCRPESRRYGRDPAYDW